jgi:hypothetical protein
VGDAILVINEWETRYMTRPEVATHLFMACGNYAELDVLTPFEGTLLDCQGMEVY